MAEGTADKPNLDKPGIATAGMLFGVFAGAAAVPQVIPWLFWPCVVICFGSSIATAIRYARSIAIKFHLLSISETTIPWWEAVSVVLLVIVEFVGSVWLAITARAQVAAFFDSAKSTLGIAIDSEIVRIAALIIACIAFGAYLRTIKELVLKGTLSLQRGDIKSTLRDFFTVSSLATVLAFFVGAAVPLVIAYEIRSLVSETARTLGAKDSRLSSIRRAAVRIAAENQLLEKQLKKANVLAASRLIEIQGRDGKDGLRKRLSDDESAINGPKGYKAQLVELKNQLGAASHQSPPASPKTIVRYIQAPAPVQTPVRLEVETNGTIAQSPFTDDQEAALVKLLTPLVGQNPTIPVYSTGGDDEKRYTHFMIKLLKKIGYKPVGPLPVPIADPSESGVMVGVPDPKKPPPAAQQFLNAIHSAGIDVHFTPWSMASPDKPFDLYLGPMSLP